MTVIPNLLRQAARETKVMGVTMAETEAKLAAAGYELSALDGDVERILAEPDDIRWLYQ